MIDTKRNKKQLSDRQGRRHGETRGRRPLTPAEKEERAKRCKEDGARLRAAFTARGLTSDSAIAAALEWKQGWVNSILNGTRWPTFHELQQLGGIGISPEYLLGLVDDNITPGQTRPRAALETDLAAHVERELSARLRSQGVDGEFVDIVVDMIDGPLMLRQLLGLVETDALEWLDEQRAFYIAKAPISRMVRYLRRLYQRASSGNEVLDSPPGPYTADERAAEHERALRADEGKFFGVVEAGDWESSYRLERLMAASKPLENEAERAVAELAAAADAMHAMVTRRKAKDFSNRLLKLSDDSAVEE